MTRGAARSGSRRVATSWRHCRRGLRPWSGIAASSFGGQLAAIALAGVLEKMRDPATWMKATAALDSESEEAHPRSACAPDERAYSNRNRASFCDDGISTALLCCKLADNRRRVRPTGIIARQGPVSGLGEREIAAPWKHAPEACQGSFDCVRRGECAARPA